MIQTYEQLKEIVLPKLRSYQTDLTNHDQKALAEYDGKFLYGYRETGTDLLRFCNSVKDYFKIAFITQLSPGTDKRGSLAKLREELSAQLVWITTNNKTFLYFDGVKFHTKSKDQITKIWQDHVEATCTRLSIMNEGHETLINLF